MTEVGNELTEPAANFLNLAPVCRALIRQGNCDQLGEMVLHLGSALAVRSVLMDVELGKLVLQNFKPSEQLKHQWRNDAGVPIVEVLAGVTRLEKVPVVAQGSRGHA